MRRRSERLPHRTSPFSECWTTSAPCLSSTLARMPLSSRHLRRRSGWSFSKRWPAVSPVIATPAGGVADHLRDGENGLAFPANDADRMAHAMVRLAMDYKLRDQLACGARRSAEALDWEGELDRLGASYREVCLAHANSTATILHRQVGSLRTSVG